MKKISGVILSIIGAIIICCSCSKNNQSDNIYEPILDENDNAKIALVTDTTGLNDASFNENTWLGIREYAIKNNKTCIFYEPDEKTDLSTQHYVEKAIKNGAEIVVMPGYLFEKITYRVQKIYPNVKFILLDAYPTNEKGEKDIAKNTYSLIYSEEQAGYLAGYSVVREGYRNIGFMGGIEVPSILKFCFGYIQGANEAAKELKLSKDEVELKYTYVGNFEDTPENEYIADELYSSGTQVIFACGGAMGYSVMRVAEKYNAVVVGVDGSQANVSSSVITSAMKDVSTSVYMTIQSIYDGNVGGDSILFDTKNHGVLLDMENSRFKNFNKNDYEKIYKKIIDEEVKISDDINFDKKIKGLGNITVKYMR